MNVRLPSIKLTEQAEWPKGWWARTLYDGWYFEAFGVSQRLASWNLIRQIAWNLSLNKGAALLKSYALTNALLALGLLWMMWRL